MTTTEKKIEESPILEVKNLRKFFPVQKGILRKIVGQVRAVDDVSISINKGETVSIVGESGCGKTTTARCISYTSSYGLSSWLF